MSKWRWTYASKRGEVLHRILRIDVKHGYEPPSPEEDGYEWYWGIDGETVCGRPLVGMPGCPGLFSRLGAKRCHRCCDLLNIEHGFGIPVNNNLDEPIEIAPTPRALGKDPE